MTHGPGSGSASQDEAFEQEVLRFLPDVHRFATSLARDPSDADDLVQETYLRAYKARDTFKPDAGTRQWLFTICRNVFLRGKERERWTAGSLDDPDAEAVGMVALHVSARDGGYADIYDRVDFGPALQRAMDMLAEPFRVVFSLVDIGGMEYAEAAEALGVPVGTVRSRLFRARRELQQHLITFARDAGIVPTAPAGGA